MEEKNRIRKLREENGMSQQILGDKIGVSQQNISRIETKPPAAIPTDLLCKLADCFCVSVDYLLSRSDERYARSNTDGSPLEIYSKLSREDKNLWMNVGRRLLDYNNAINRINKRER